MKTVDALMLARHMFEFEVNDFDMTDEAVEDAWSDEGVRLFWMARAESVLEFLNFAQVER